MPFEIIRNDITTMRVDAIVNAANTALQMGGGVCGAIFHAAGEAELTASCNALGHCDVGQAVVTPGFRLPAKHIIHTVGPIWQGGNHNEEALLRSCYQQSLKLALDMGLESVAFPLISSGIYGYPKEQALSVAVETIKQFLDEHDLLVYMVVFDQASVSLSSKLEASLKQFIDDHYVDDRTKKDADRRLQNFDQQKVGHLYEPQADFYTSANVSYSSKKSNERRLEDVVAQLEESFSQMLLRLIDERGMTDVQAYRKANVDRRLFSKIRKDIHYSPSKPTAIAFAIALELNLDMTKDLLDKAGYSLSRSNRFDVIIEYFIHNKIYDIFEINEALFTYQEALIGAAMA